MPQRGHLHDTGDVWEPYRLIDPAGELVPAAQGFLKELQAAGSPATTIRSYGMDLLRWFRFLWAIGVLWDHATRIEARDFVLWLQTADKPQRDHWRRMRNPASGEAACNRRVPAARPAPGTPNPLTGKPIPGSKYAVTTRAHCETVLRTFYDFHLEMTGKPIVNPFPLDRARRSDRAHAHHNPMKPYAAQRVGRYRPKVPARVPRRIPDDAFNEIFAGLKSNRDRALLCFWVSTGARASELLGACRLDADPGQQLIGVVRKGSRAYQQLPASPDSFVWLRLYQAELWRLGVSRARTEPLWWMLRKPLRPLNYHAARAMFVRVNGLLGSNWSLHDLRHTAAYRMARDPELALTDVQWILGHAHLSHTQIYLTPSPDETIEHVLAHHARQARKTAEAPKQPPLAPGYNQDSMSILFGQS